VYRAGSAALVASSVVFIASSVVFVAIIFVIGGAVELGGGRGVGTSSDAGDITDEEFAVDMGAVNDAGGADAGLVATDDGSWLGLGLELVPSEVA